MEAGKVTAEQAYGEVVNRLGVSVVREAFELAVREQANGNAGMFIDDADEEMGAPPSALLAISHDTVTYAVDGGLYELPRDQALAMIAPEAPQSS